MKDEENTPASYGEPWRGDSDGIYNALGERLSCHESDCGEIARSVQCVNACQGIADPVEAIREAREVIFNFHDYLNTIGHTATAREVAKTIAKLNNTAP